MVQTTRDDDGGGETQTSTMGCERFDDGIGRRCETLKSTKMRRLWGVCEGRRDRRLHYGARGNAAVVLAEPKGMGSESCDLGWKEERGKDFGIFTGLVIVLSDLLNPFI
ncbi:hypothetical protein E3N88_38520 [Mikania micrantha]|uniref:Uncharacterized protein n=1 Tax=Mikania micrantha TaxID=192012 RepID=A0A5N6LU91_9ASTR|nr:hypothetical protein E3N88_38520 [Mikania micrantha]